MSLSTATTPDTRPAAREKRCGLGVQVFTTGQIAKLCKVAPRTVSKWFDAGRLRGYRVPGSQDRRVMRAELVRFLKEYGLPLGDLARCVLAVGLPDTLADGLARLLPEWLALKRATDAYQAGVASWETVPAVAVLGEALGLAECQTVALRLTESAAPPAVLALRPADRLEGWLGVTGVVELPAVEATAQGLALALARVLGEDWPCP